MKMERCRDTVVGRLFNAFLEEIGGEIRTSPAMIIQLEGTNNSTIAYKQEYSRRTSSMDLLAYHDWSVYIALHCNGRSKYKYMAGYQSQSRVSLCVISSDKESTTCRA